MNNKFISELLVVIPPHPVPARPTPRVQRALEDADQGGFNPQPPTLMPDVPSALRSLVRTATRLSVRGFVSRLFVQTRAMTSLLVVCLGLVPLARAQNPDAGSITGRVLDAATGNFLEGAEVTIEGTRLKTSTARGGAFTLTNVPAGAHQVVVNYLGSQPATETVTVAAGETVSLQVKLNSEVVLLDAFVVTGTPEGVAQALSLQKVSVQAKLVAASDQFGEISEGNVGEYLKFLPGVNIDYNVNDARGISLRGLSTAFTIVSVDGTPMAGTSSIDDTRRFEFEQIAMNNVATTELFKTVTPDIPASATGGYVNFVTKSAFDHDEIQRVTYNISVGAPSSNFSLTPRGGVWGHGTKTTVRPSLEANLARRLNEKLGININYRYSDKYDDAPRNIETWNTTGAGALANPQLLSYTVQDEQKLTHREAFATKLDYRPGEHTKIFVTGQWNFYDLLFTQRGPVFNLGSNPVMSGDSVTSGTAGTRRVDNAQLQRRKWGVTWHFNGTIEQEFGNGSKLSVTPYWSHANGYYDDQVEGFISSTQSITYSNAAIPFDRVMLTGIRDLSRAPVVTLTKGTVVTPVDYLRDLGNYTFSNTANGTNFQSRPWEAVDVKKGVNGHYVIDLKNDRLPVRLDAGFALDKTNRTIWRPTLRGPIANLTGASLRALIDPDYTKDAGFGFGPYQAVDPYKVWSIYENALTTLAVNDRRWFDEDNQAAYLRADFTVTPDLLLIGGARWEKREINARASALSNNVQEVALVDLNYSKLYPSLNFKYSPRREFVVRGGVSRTVGHPDYVDLLPLVTLESTASANDGRISVPAPDLQPYFSNNFDVSFDYYLGNTGVIGLALYQKNIKNFIISRSMTAPELSLAASSRGYNPADFTSGTITVNGPNSKLQGFELSYAQKLSFLPKPFNGLNVQANYTYIDINADDLDTFYSQSRAVAPKSFNLIVDYRIGRFSVTTTTNWVDESLYGGFVNTSYFTGTANADPLLDTRLLRYKDPKATTDVKVEWSFSERFSIYALVRNVTNSARTEFFRGYTRENSHIELPMRYGEFGEPYLVFGARGTF